MKNYKASILAVTLMIMSVITVIALSVSLVAIRQKESALNLGKSNAAFQNAESGTERVLQQIRNIGPGKTVADIETTSLICDHATGKLNDSAGNFSAELKKSNVSEDPIHCEKDKALPVGDVGLVKSTGIGNNQDSRAVEAIVPEMPKLPADADVIILIDWSRSVGTDANTGDAKTIKDDVKGLINGLGDTYQAGVYFFNEKKTTIPTSPGFSLQQLTLLNATGKQTLTNWIDSNPLGNPIGGTNTGKAIDDADVELKSARARAGKPKAIVLITDGCPNVAYYDPGVLSDYDCSAKCDPAGGSCVTDPAAYWNNTSGNKAKDAAGSAKGDGISIFVVSIGFDDLFSTKCKTNARQLMQNQVASSSTDYIPIDGFSSLKTKLDGLKP